MNNIWSPRNCGWATPCDIVIGLISIRGRTVLLLLLIQCRLSLQLTSDPSTAGDAPAVPAVERLLEESRQLRREAVPGWRRRSLQILERAAALHGGVPMDGIREEAVFALSSPDFSRETWDPPAHDRVLDIDPTHERYVALSSTPTNNKVQWRRLDHSVLDEVSIESGNLPHWLGHDATGGWFVWATKFGGNITLNGRKQLDASLPPVGFSTLYPWASIRAVSLDSTGSHAAIVGVMPDPSFSALFIVSLPNAGSNATPRLQGKIEAVAWSPDDVRIGVLVAAPPSLLVYESGLGTIAATIPLSAAPLALAWLPNGREILVGTEAGISRIDFEESTVVSFGNLGRVDTLALNENGNLLLSAGKGSPIRLWDVAAQLPLVSLKETADRLEFSESGKRMSAIQTAKGTASLWSINSARDVVYFVPENKKGIPFPGKSEGLRLGTQSVEVNTGSNAPVTLPTPIASVSAFRSINGQYVRILLADGRMMDWNIAQLGQRLRSLGIPW